MRRTRSSSVGRRSVAAPAHAPGDRPKKAVGARHRRELARWAPAAFEVSERRVSRLLPIRLATLRYQSRRDPQMALGMQLRELSASRVRFGYRRLAILLKPEGRAVEEKRLKHVQGKLDAWREDYGPVRPHSSSRRSHFARFYSSVSKYPNRPGAARIIRAAPPLSYSENSWNL